MNKQIFDAFAQKIADTIDGSSNNVSAHVLAKTMGVLSVYFDTTSEESGRLERSF